MGVRVDVSTALAHPLKKKKDRAGAQPTRHPEAHGESTSPSARRDDTGGVVALVAVSISTRRSNLWTGRFLDSLSLVGRRLHLPDPRKTQEVFDRAAALCVDDPFEQYARSDAALSASTRAFPRWKVQRAAAWRASSESTPDFLSSAGVTGTRRAATYCLFVCLFL